jgi:hypothetical protein
MKVQLNDGSNSAPVGHVGVPAGACSATQVQARLVRLLGGRFGKGH